MKKFLLIAVAAFGMLMTACSKDEVAQPVAEKSTVTFSVAAPELATRAEHGDGTLAKDLTYAVYNRADGAKLFDGTATMNAELKATVEIPFVNGMTYDVLFWAESENSPYAVNWTAKTVGYNPAVTLVSNSKDYDAFYAYVNDIPEITGPVTKTVELKRPFAQLNIKTNDAAKAAQSGVVVEEVKVVVKKGYSSFDLVDGTGEDQGDVTFGFATTETTTDLLAVNYLFTGGQKSLVDVEFTYTDVNGKVDAAGEVMEFASVPVQRNYRTNIVGSLLTSDGNFNIETKPGFDGEPGHEYDGNHNVSLNGVNYNSFLAALAAAVDGDEIVLNTNLDITLGDTRAEVNGFYAVIEGKSIAVNLNGKSIYANVGDVAKNSGIFQVKKGAGLTIKGEGKIHLNTAKAINCMSVFISNEAGTVNLEGDIVWTLSAYDDWEDSLIPAFVDNNSTGGNSTLNIYAGDFTFHRNLFRNFANNNNAVAAINIYGGTFNGLPDDAGKIWNQKPSGSILEGAGEVNVYGGTFNNVKIDDDFNVNGFVTVTTADELTDALANATKDVVVVFGNDIEGDAIAEQKADVNVVVNGNGYKYTGTITLDGNSRHTGEETLTFLNIKFFANKSGYIIEANSAAEAVRYAHNVKVKDCTFNANNIDVVGAMRYRQCYNMSVENCTANGLFLLIWATGGDKITVDGVTATNCVEGGISSSTTGIVSVSNTTITSSTAYGYGIRANSSDDANDVTLTIENCDFTADAPILMRQANKHNYTIALQGENTLTAKDYAIIATGGEYKSGAALSIPAGTVNITGADDLMVYPREVLVSSWSEFTAALNGGAKTIILKDNITHDANYQLQKDVVIDLNGKSMTLPMINIHNKTTVKNGTINGKVYARKNSEIVFNNVKFSGAVADNLSTEGHLAIQGGCKSLYAKDCLFSPTSVSGSQTKPLSFEGGSTIMKFENCEFKNSPYKKQIYFNSLSATAKLDFTNCNFNNKTPNIMFAAACPLTNLTMSGTTKLSSVTLETNRAKDAVTAEDWAYFDSLVANNSITNVRLFYAGGSSEYYTPSNN